MNGTADPASPQQQQPGSSSTSSISPRTLKKRRPGESAAGVSSKSDSADSNGTTSLESKLGSAASHGSTRQAKLRKKKMPPLPRWARYEVPRKLLHSSIGFLCLYLYCVHQDVTTLVVYLSRALIVITTVDVLRFASSTFEKTYESLLGFLMRESEKTTWNGVIWYLVGVIFVLVTLPRDLAVLSVMLLSWADTTASIVGRKLGKYTPKLPSPPFADRKSLAGSFGAFVVGGVSAWAFFTYAVPLGSENDLSWVGPAAAVHHTTHFDLSWLPTWLARFFRSGYIGKSTGFPQALNFNFLGAPVALSVKLPAPRSTLSLWQVELVTASATALAEALDIYGLDDNLTLPVAAGLMIWAVLYFLG